MLTRTHADLLFCGALWAYLYSPKSNNQFCNQVQASYVEYITPTLYDDGSGFAGMKTMKLHISQSQALGATVLIAVPRVAILGYLGFIGVRLLAVTFEMKGKIDS
jgi:hypothetical protein